MKPEQKHNETFLTNKVDKKHGFSVPKDYFSSLNDEISAKISTDSFSDAPGFDVPENYFENLEQKILEQVAPKTKEIKVISLKDRVLKIIPYVAAATVLLFITLNTFDFNFDEKITLDSLSDADFEYWLDSNSLNATDIAIVLDEEVLDENSFYYTDLEDENIEDYINSINTTTLLNEIN